MGDLPRLRYEPLVSCVESRIGEFPTARTMNNRVTRLCQTCDARGCATLDFHATARETRQVYRRTASGGYRQFRGPANGRFLYGHDRQQRVGLSRPSDRQSTPIGEHWNRSSVLTV